MSKLEQFALETLRLLEEQREWSADTTDDIFAAAENLGLVTTDQYGFCVRTPEAKEA